MLDFQAFKLKDPLGDPMAFIPPANTLDLISEPVKELDGSAKMSLSI